MLTVGIALTRTEYGQHAPFWTGMASVWGAHGDLLAAGDESTVTSLATLGAFLASLCAQCPQNQHKALSVDYTASSLCGQC